MLLLWTILFWSRPAISHHSVLLISRRSLPLRLCSIRYQPCAKPEPTAKYSWWNNKENNEFTLQKICWSDSQKEKPNRPLNPKPIVLSRMLFLVLQKWRKRRVFRDPTPYDNPLVSDADLVIHFDVYSTEEEGQDADCVFCTGLFSEDHHGEEEIRCAKYFRWEHTLCAGMREDFICEPCQGKHCLVLRFYHLYLQFFKFCNYSLCFLCKLFTSTN